MFDYIDPYLLPLGFFYGICGFISVIGNIIMLAVTITNRKMRSPCHFIIFFHCLADCLHSTGQFPFVYHLFGNMTSTQSACFFIQIIPMIGVCMGGPILVVLGCDRLLAVILASGYKHHTRNLVRYLSLMMFLPCCFTISMILISYNNSTTQIQVTCAVPLAFNGYSFAIYSYAGFFIYASIIVIYSILFYHLKHRKRQSASFHSVFRAIVITVTIVILGWMTTSITNMISYIITKNPFHIALMQMYAGVSVNLGMASNLFVYFGTSSEYRKAILGSFGCWKQNFLQDARRSIGPTTHDRRRTESSQISRVYSNQIEISATADPAN